MLPSRVEFLRHIFDECSYLLKEYQANTFDDFVKNERLSKAVCRSLEIIGEACNRIHPDIKAAFPKIAWREMSDMRNRIIHHYFGIDYDVVWDAIKTDIPLLREDILSIINNSK